VTLRPDSRAAGRPKESLLARKSPAVSGRARRNAKEAAAETTNSSPDVLIFH